MKQVELLGKPVGYVVATLLLFSGAYEHVLKAECFSVLYIGKMGVPIY